MIEHRINLTDGRTLAAAEFGDPGGTPVIYSHGFPGSRLGGELGQAAATQHRVRLIAFDRPGWGASTPQRGRRLADWPDDIAQAADQLECPRFNLVGVSGGAPFALACAAALPDRVDRVGLVCGLGPIEAMHRDDGMMGHTRFGLTLASRTPWLVRPVLAIVGPLLRHFFRPAVANLIRHAGEADRATLTDPEIRPVLEREFREGFRQGGAGASADALIYGNDWGLEFAAIQAEVSLWHGDADRVVPSSLAHWVAARIPDAKTNFHPGEGHFSIVIRYLPEILNVLSPSTE
ncbi:MAG: alpha/beta hydrolase [Acidobacteriota bacterium]|nr:alpha/beta hydrolase [Acidobacteriota bacterium]MDH3784436.1 alpha/beta hydrolase [Acidobacteriota bacterium]